MSQFSWLSKVPFAKKAIRRLTTIDDPALQVDLFDTSFKNPVGLAAGFDKDGKWIQSLGTLGFSHLEIGTLTGQAQPGNPEPRLFRLPKDKAIVNCMGFNNRGSAAAEESLKAQAADQNDENQNTETVRLGINIGLTKKVAESIQDSDSIQPAIDDYLLSFRRVLPYADYITVNVSSPNTPGLRDLQHPSKLGELIRALTNANQETTSKPKPILVKLAPDLSEKELDETLDVIVDQQISGIIATNTTISGTNLKTCPKQVDQLRSNCPGAGGGISGQPLTQKSREMVRQIYRKTEGRLKIVGVGGIMSGQDAWDMIAAGASMVQVYSGFIYGGPLFVKSVNRFLSLELQKRNIKSIAEVTGRDA